MRASFQIVWRCILAVCKAVNCLSRVAKIRESIFAICCLVNGLCANEAVKNQFLETRF